MGDTAVVQRRLKCSCKTHRSATRCKLQRYYSKRMQAAALLQQEDASCSAAARGRKLQRYDVRLHDASWCRQSSLIYTIYTYFIMIINYKHYKIVINIINIIK